MGMREVTIQIVDHSLRRVVQAVEPEAARLPLIEGNGFLWSHLGSCMVYVDVIKHALLPKLERVLSRSGQRFLHSFTREIFSPLRHLFHFFSVTDEGQTYDFPQYPFCKN